MTVGKNNDSDERQVTVETPAPIPVEPPQEALPDPVAVAVEDATPSSNSRPSTCTVIAPSTLSAGYTFPANVDGIDFVVTVPDNGVTEGQQFQVPYPNNQSNTNNNSRVGGSLNIPEGRWRNELCDCCEVVATPMFWMGWCCNPILMGQVMQRFKLNPFGVPDNYQNTCVIMTVFWVVMLAFFWGFIGGSSGVSSFFAIVWLVFMTIAILNARYYYRSKYNIQPKNCSACDGRMEDCCCAFWCECCVAIQLVRHTHDHHNYPYQCFTQTGLKPNDPEVGYRR